MSKHYIARAGIHGCMCNYVSWSETYEGAVDELASLHELGRNRTRELEKNGYLELNLDKDKDGNEYCEITECDCDTPEDHQDY